MVRFRTFLLTTALILPALAISSAATAQVAPQPQAPYMEFGITLPSGDLQMGEHTKTTSQTSLPSGLNVVTTSIAVPVRDSNDEHMQVAVVFNVTCRYLSSRNSPCSADNISLKSKGDKSAIETRVVFPDVGMPYGLGSEPAEVTVPSVKLPSGYIAGGGIGMYFVASDQADVQMSLVMTCGYADVGDSPEPCGIPRSEYVEPKAQQPRPDIVASVTEREI